MHKLKVAKVVLASTALAAVGAAAIAIKSGNLKIYTDKAAKEISLDQRRRKARRRSLAR